MELDLGTVLKNRRIVINVPSNFTRISLSLRPTKSLSLSGKRKQREDDAFRVEIDLTQDEDSAPEPKKQRPAVKVSQEISEYRASGKKLQISNMAYLRMALGKIGLTGKNIDYIFDNNLIEEDFANLIERSEQATETMLSHAAERCIAISSKFYRPMFCPSLCERKLRLCELGFNDTIVELLIDQMDSDYVDSAILDDLAADLIAVCCKLHIMGLNGETTPNLLHKSITTPELLMTGFDQSWKEAFKILRSPKNNKMVGAKRRQIELGKANAVLID